MNKEQSQSKCDQFTARVRQEWGDLTDDEVKKAEGNIDELVTRIQENYGDSRK